MFPKRVVFHKAKGKKTSETVRVFCDASTWTGENHFQSARIGRTPKGPELPAPKLVLDAPEAAAWAEQETGEQAAPLPAQHSEAPLPATAGDTQDAEVSQDPEAKPSMEVMQHQEHTEQTKREVQSAQGSSEESKAEAVLHSSSSSAPNEQLGCGDREATPLTQTMVKAEVHVSADVQGGPGKVQSAAAEPEPGEEQEAGGVCAPEDTGAGKAPGKVPVQKAADSLAAVCTTEESELPLETAETREGTRNVQRPAEEQAVEEKVCCAAKAPPDLQWEQDKEGSVIEDVVENAFEAEQAEEMAEDCDDGQISEELPCCLAETHAALQGKIAASNGGNPEEH